MKPNKIFKKIKNRLVDYGVHTVPFQQHYRPTGYYAKITGDKGLLSAEPAEFLEFFPAYPCDLNLQDPFYEQCIAALRPQPAPLIPHSFILSIPNGRVQQNYLGHCITVISGQNQIVEEVSFQANGSATGVRAADMDVFKQKFFPKPAYYKGTVFSMLAGNSCSTNYYHWLYDAVPRVYLLKKSGLFEKVDYFLMPALEKKFHRESLHLLGLEGKKIIECKNYIHLQADKLIVSSHIRHREIVPQWACRYHREHIAEKLAPKETSRYIYIARGDSTIRQVQNEAKLMDLLANLGFESVYLSKLSFTEQVKLFASAQVIVSPHGAGLANLSFCKEGTSLVELFSEHYVRPTYQVLAVRMHLNYSYLICQSDSRQPKTLLEANKTNITVNFEELMKKIDPIINSLSYQQSKVFNA